MRTTQNRILTTVYSIDEQDEVAKNDEDGKHVKKASDSSKSTFKRWFGSVHGSISRPRRSRSTSPAPGTYPTVANDVSLSVSIEPPVSTDERCLPAPIVIPPKIYLHEATPATGFYDDDIYDFLGGRHDAPWAPKRSPLEIKGSQTTPAVQMAALDLPKSK